METRREASESVTVEFGWDISGELGPGEAIVATATADSGQADVPYIATVTISAPRSEHRIVYQENGVLENAVYVFAEATTRKLVEGRVAAAASVQGEHHPGLGHIVESSDLVEETEPGHHVQPRSSAEHATEKIS